MIDKLDKDNPKVLKEICQIDFPSLRFLNIRDNMIESI